ncbi:pimeloyl-ACP methyl ester carboxylesterase [Streptomonospora salina]|uniref:Pimeloyl-ACP methyl ester carboxylesterase n=1 Tax=Streptomonospora salina TaxID=104205 RepID=A0A841E2K8_9ACTN|nr:alpha/beta hydrolase [Streptomonospora salina]MBB5996932.1 pimeloyl-ACP methyl ester carboxylesterase [Streptomonospora salina]
MNRVHLVFMDTSRIVYDDRGTGEAVLLLHGLGHHRRAWRTVAAGLAPHYRVVAADLPGFGESPAPGPGGPRAYDVDYLVDAVLQLCADLGLEERPHVVGNSLGGAVALEMAARGRAASVTALSPIGFGSAARTAGARTLALGARAAARIPQRLVRAAAHTPPARALAQRALRADPGPPAAHGIAFDTSVIAPGSPFVRMARHVARYTFSGTVACPVTVAWGERDRLLPPAGARRALRRIPHARSVVLPGCGHIPMADDPRAVAAVVLRGCRGAAPYADAARR